MGKWENARRTRGGRRRDAIAGRSVWPELDDAELSQYVVSTARRATCHARLMKQLLYCTPNFLVALFPEEGTSIGRHQDIARAT